MPDELFRVTINTLYMPKPTIEQEIKLTLDYDISPADTLCAAKCDWIYPWMLEHCPAAWQKTGKVEVTVVLIDMGGVWETAEALPAISELGLVAPADNCALWTLSAKYSDLQREIVVVDPGTVWTGERGHPCMAFLRGGHGDRSADLGGGVARGWDRSVRVLALKNMM